jgi:BioD-like phosphotransacetylase family protein
MPFLFIGSTGNHAGQSLLTWAIARRLVEKGLSVGFIKPLGTQPIRIKGLWTDQDAFLLKQVLNLQEPLERICPYLVSEEAWREKGKEEILEEFKTLAQELSVGKDVLLIMGSQHIFFNEAPRPVPDTSLIAALKTDVVLVDRYVQTSTSIYSILSVYSLLKDSVKGIILNRVPPAKLKEIRDQMVPSLAQKGIPITTALPEDPLLSFQTLRDIREVLDGELLWGEENLGRPVGGMTVGSADLKGELLIFKRVYNKIILTEPSSLDTGIEAPPAPRSITGILLTGGRNPAPQVLQAVKKARIPIILVKDDTLAALERLEHSTPSLSPEDEIKVHHFTELMDRDSALDSLLQSLGLIL